MQLSYAGFEEVGLNEQYLVLNIDLIQVDSNPETFSRGLPLCHEVEENLEVLALGVRVEGLNDALCLADALAPDAGGQVLHRGSH